MSVVENGSVCRGHVLLQLAVAVLLTAVIPSAEAGQKTGNFEAMKVQNGSVLCASSLPDTKTPVRSKLDCYRNCVSSGCLCASGANYRKKEKLCETYSASPTDFHVDPDCEFYQAGLHLK